MKAVGAAPPAALAPVGLAVLGRAAQRMPQSALPARMGAYREFAA